MIKLVYFVFIVITLYAQDITLDLLPFPKQVEVGNDVNISFPENVFLSLFTDDTSGLNIIFELLKNEFPKINQYESGADPYKILIGLPNKDSLFKTLCGDLNLIPEPSFGDEGYVLLFEEQQTIIAANNNAGLFYGTQTLMQLLKSLKVKRLLRVKITDWPDFKFRGVHDDISRGPVPTRAFMKQQIRRIAALKLNVLSYYTEHIMATKSHGDFAPTNGSITIDDWIELDSYAQKYFVQLIPNFQSLAHFEKILAHPQYQHLGDTERLLSPTRKESFEFLQDIYSEMAPAFKSPFFIVHGDETWDLGRGASKQAVDSVGIAQVYSNHMNRISSELKKYDKRMIMWADMALEHREILDLLPKEALLGAWNYSALDSFNDMIGPLKAKGFDVLICPGVLNSNRMMPDYTMTIPNIRQFVKDGLENRAFGVLNTVWDDGGEALFSRDWYGVAYAAEQSWHVNNFSLQEFDQRFNTAIYGDQTHSFLKVLDILNNLADLNPTQEMNLSVFWQQLVPEPGDNIFINDRQWQEIKTIADSAQAVFSEIEADNFLDDLHSIRLTINQYRYMANARLQLLDAGDYYRKACSVQTSDRIETVQLLSKTLETVTQLRTELNHLKDAAKHAWLIENHSYWLNFVQYKYDKKIADYDRILAFIKPAIERFKIGGYLPPPNEVCLSLYRQKGNYFQDWLLCGPFPNHSDQGRDVDYLKNMGGEKSAIPMVGMVFNDLSGVATGWKKHSSPLNAIVDFSTIYDQNTEAVAYAYCRIESPGMRTVKARFGSNDGIQVFLNGTKIFDKSVKRSLVLDEEEVLLRLHKGYNHLLLKIDQNKGGWGFSFRLPESDVRNHKHKYTIQE